MQKIYLILQNVKHNGEYYPAGQLIQGEFAGLVTSRIAREIIGAKSIEDAEAIIAKEKEVTGEQEKKEKEQVPENTWGPKKDEPEIKEPEVYTGPMVKVRFLKQYEVVDENNEKTGEKIEAGTEVEIPEPTVGPLVENGFVEKITDANVEAPAEIKKEDTPPPTDENTGDNL